MKKLVIYFLFSILFIINCKKDKTIISSKDDSIALSEIVYVSDIDGNSNIYTMDIDGNNKRQLTQNPDSEYRLKFSPDGNSLAYYSKISAQLELWIMHKDNQNKKKLIDISDNYNWSPKFSINGQKLLLLSNDGQSLQIINIDGTNHVTIDVSMMIPYRIRSFVFSPDGSKILFSSDKYNSGNYDICIMDINTTQIENLNLSIDTNNEIGPRYSPDGNSLVYFSEGSNYNIWSFDLSTQTQTKLTPDTTNSPFDPRYTPDGSKIVFTCEGHMGAKNNSMKILGNPSLFIMNTDGSELIQLSETGGTYSAEVIFSDSDNILYYKRDLDIYSVDLTRSFRKK